jgi:hypothetical protein
LSLETGCGLLPRVGLSTVIGIAGVFTSVWCTAKVFRIGILMFGKPPDLQTLIK